MIKEESLSLEDKQKIAQNLVERYLRENDYKGIIPEVLLTDEGHSFTVDSKDKETGAKRREKIYFSKNDIADPNVAFSRLFGHEKAHMNTYDEGKKGEDTSIHTREKIGSENKNKVFTEEEKAAYLSNLRDKYKDQKSIEQQFAEAKLVPEKDKEHFIYEIAIEVLEKNPYIVEDTLALIDSTLLLNLSEEEVRARAEKNKKELDKLFGNNDKDEIDNLNDIKNYKSIIISGNKNIKGEEEDKEEQVTNVESASASSPSPLPDPNNKDDKEMEELKKKWGGGSFDDVDDSIEHHYKKHGEEVGASDLRQYLRKAKEFARNLKRARIVGRVKGKTPGVIRYEKMGKYIDLAPNGDIISFGEFNPLNPLK
ncbi:hypothetical protein KST22_06495 [Fusobacterium nucleatum]